jgi:hypothetical protein
MPLNFDRVLAILGIMLAIPGIVVLFQAPRLEEGLLLSALMLVISAYSAHLYWWEYVQPSFTHLEMDKSLHFQAPNNQNNQIAIVETVVKSKVNHSGSSQLWFRNFLPGDKFRNVLINGKAPLQTKIRAGSFEFCNDFDRPLSSGEVVEVRLSYEVHDGFADSRHEFVTHVVGTKTRKLKLKVRFDPTKPGRNVQCHVIHGTGVGRFIRNLPVNRENAVEIEIPKPKAASRYTIEWDW